MPTKLHTHEGMVASLSMAKEEQNQHERVQKVRRIRKDHQRYEHQTESHGCPSFYIRPFSCEHLSTKEDL